MATKAPATKLFYPGDDEKVHFKRPNRKPKAAALRKSITPGTVLIILAGRFKGRRVVFLKQLQSGLLLVTGPYKVNGVPLRRVNQAYVIATSTKVPLDGVDASKIDDAFFARKATARVQANKDNSDASKFFQVGAELTEEQKAQVKAKRSNQSAFDSALLANIKKVEHLKSYLATRFSLRQNQLPHLLRF